ncbi:MAG: glycosyltransferase family 1 protein [Planctomycetes bacterium]|nr:glycosyltransferase family 1 protein [Planctomycetota bacterium]
MVDHTSQPTALARPCGRIGSDFQPALQTGCPERPFGGGTGDEPMNRKSVTLCCRVLKSLAGSETPLVESLTRCGCDVTLILEDTSAGIPPAGAWLVICGNAAWFPRIRRRLLAIPRHRRPYVLLWHAEPLPPARASGLPLPWLNLREAAKIVLRDARATDVYTNYFTLRNLHRAGIPDVLVLSSRGRQEFLAERGIPGHFAPLGCDRSMGRDLGIPRDIDVLFLGILNVPRRNRLLQALKAQNINLTEAGSWTDPELWGENRTRLLNRTKILLNFARTPGEFSGYRLSLGMANKALVISEPIYQPEPFVPGRHFVMVPPGEMAASIRHYLDAEHERSVITEAAARFVHEEATLQRSTERMVNLMEEYERQHCS